jgi:acetolactate synthase-1/2/3 large subunit
MRAADYIIEYLYRFGVKYIFLVPGGGAMYLNDAIGIHKGIKYIACMHEQAATFAASAYAKYTGELGVVCVTTGVGGTNTLTGVLDAYQDGVPLLILSGQVNRKETTHNCKAYLRQFGVQEFDIIPMVERVTKYARMIQYPTDIKYHLDSALTWAFHGHPGPIWLDVPLDIQFADIPKPNFEYKKLSHNKEFKINHEQEIVQMIQQSQRPIIIAGHGIRLGESIETFKHFIEEFRIPYVSTKMGIDLLPYNHPLYIGNIGNRGDRPGNFALQNSDLVISLGARLSICSTGYRFDMFAREAKKIVVDINPEEHKKNTVSIDLFEECDVKTFLEQIGLNLEQKSYRASDVWVSTCQKWKKIFKTYSPDFSKTEKVNLYYFIEMLSRKSKPGDVFVGDAGSTMFVPAQGLRLKEKQRLIFSSAQTSMGFVIPACVGISLARDKGEVIGLCGDGSMQMNIHTLQTIKHHNLPVKLFMWNNRGYLTMRNTQMNYFKRTMAESPETGVSLPDIEKIAWTYGIKYFKVRNSAELPEVIDQVLKYGKHPVICEVICLENQVILGTAGRQLTNGKFVSSPFEDMAPFLDRKTFYDNMIIKPEVYE